MLRWEPKESSGVVKFVEFDSAERDELADNVVVLEDESDGASCWRRDTEGNLIACGRGLSLYSTSSSSSPSSSPILIDS